ncbi:MAG: hypothetical protein NT062_03565, partial [Proteobacteria bacterium]|nr:hypothetical protein [Pseudomonadota bacterium]
HSNDLIAHVVANARALAAQVRVSIADLQARVRALSAGVDGVRQRLDARSTAMLAAIDLAIDRAKLALDKLDPLLANVAVIGDRLARGEGSIGRLMTDPEFPEDAKELGKILKRQPWKIIARPPD